ncbi:MAG TPA: hypothetical protein VEW46_05855, partial [Pyrinomonadaceae bacterium]|nr:hypothetical protein [Pyrinomonadaceae bacterium]
LTLVLVVTATLTIPISALGQKRKPRPAPERTLVGNISDASCGLQHMAGMNEKDCTLMCVKNGNFLLADRDHKVVYQLDKTGQEKAKEFAGQKVRVKGRVTGKTIRVTTIEAAT